MASRYPALIAASLLVIVTFELLRRRSLREKYAALWLLLALTITGFSIYPHALATISKIFGFEVPSNFFLLLIVVFLVGVVMQLSLEVGKLEHEAQRLAEEFAIHDQIHRDNGAI